MDGDVQRHDGPKSPVCVDQWCCGCAEHPVGKPWGWNHAAWEAHFDAHHPLPVGPPTVYAPGDFA